jgi:hypothetical protein
MAKKKRATGGVDVTDVAATETGNSLEQSSLTQDSVVSDVILPTGPENIPTPATELLRAEAGDVHAQTVTMERAGAELVSAERVVMTNSGARTIDASSAQVDRSGVLAVQSDKAVFYNSTAVAVVAEEVRLVRGMVLALKADQTSVEGEVKVGVYAGPATAGVRPLVDASGAAAFGVAFGAAVALIGSLLRRIFR